ncbi:unnamed protein product [Nippostrongylus brasiliensis]|uniref:ZP domain-containing protein n=1 Tax=Nippostrongylus brasiliensis TaxID=27835 RepID=A0A0N4XXZ1_NIPBR|nr:unnamed protein product [Nippostrongylus brasiliensis]
MQGTRLGDFALESEDVCVAANDEQELRYDILCSIGLMTVTSSETTVHFHLEGPTPDELRSYRSQSYICSHRFVD